MDPKQCPVCGSIGLPRNILGKKCSNNWHKQQAEEPPVQIVDLVKTDLDERRRIGIGTYGEALRANNGRDAMWDAYEEILDLACYLRQYIEERDAT